MLSQFENQSINQEVARLNLPNSRIKHFAPASYAQAGEDVIVEGILAAKLCKSQRSWDSVFYVEIGANHPISTSSTYLMYQRGARGVLVEPNPELEALIRTARPDDVLVRSVVLPAPQASATLFIGNAHELSSVDKAHVESFGDFNGLGGIREHIEVSAIGINELLTPYANKVDYLSIDCEGLDHDLVKAIDYERIRPGVIQCEQSEHRLKGNRAQIINLMECRSYRLAAMTDNNVIFERST
ncbi:MAG: FkbM family methyltransferase [Mesorhizobium sp.]|uniref:FkbM family methyltransferase n=1 Tax=Mesorhizobium sp. TaxID=1871066 RepID=UPI001202921E|nr:FkbM family methyltransferase [Mesorhizobium sp.]TIP69690.1 MAG: FkbM family methyltransferase [Mesorhizobium sp.]TIR47880.1 MAG: FkbM family methyltransferase [Mesorhizobium sp.]TJV96812.1 MAG: FkbM family methyltransferase [Mesorhizobium sp.]